MIILGIDPGLYGAVAVLSVQNGPSLSSDAKITYLVIDTPILLVTRKDGKVRPHYDLDAMYRLLSKYQHATHAALEKAQPIPTKFRRQQLDPSEKSDSPGMGTMAAFALGQGFGNWEMALVALGISRTIVTPQRWKKTMMDGMPKGKDASRIRAMQLFPGADLRLKKHHGRADALLIAEHCRRTLITPPGI